MRSHLNRVVVLFTLLVALPAVAIVGRVRRRAARRLAVRAIRFVTRACGIRVEVHGGERLHDGRSYVLVPNHTSPLDIAAILIARPDARFVAAAELFRIPLLGPAMRALGTVPIERHDRASSHERIDELASGTDDEELVMFPEGGISQTGEVLPFKTGAFVVAIQRGAEVVPVALSGSAEALPAKARLRVRPGRIRVDLLAPVATSGLTTEDRTDLSVRTRDTIVSQVRVGQVGRSGPRWTHRERSSDASCCTRAA